MSTGAGTQGADIVLRAEHLSVEYEGAVATRAVRDVSIELRRGEILGIVGESGCGKSTLAYAITRLLRPPARLTAGSVKFYGHGAASPVDIMQLNPAAVKAFRWSKISMVFQSAMNALNPVASLRKQFRDIFAEHVPEMDADDREQRSRDLLEMVGIDPARLKSFPHELSGGMRQRVVIAMALALKPEVVVMDEPTTALDVVVQRELLDEIEQLREDFGFSIIFITHDVSLLLEMSDHLAVMYAGEVIEYAPSEQVASAPAHPYTLGLLQSFPELRGKRQLLRGIPGSPPGLRDDLQGCAFTSRCPFAFEPCPTIKPSLAPPAHTVAQGGSTSLPWEVACHLHDSHLQPRGPPQELASGPGTVLADKDGGLL